MDQSTGNYGAGFGEGIAETEDRGSYIKGIIGALLGALIGGVLWFVIAAFADLVSAYVGFFAGLLATWGYKKLHGRRNVAFAIVTVILVTMLALLAAQLAAYLYAFCADPDFQEAAADYGIPVRVLVINILLLPENIKLILPDILKALGIGLLGVVFTIGGIKKYCRFGAEASILPTAAQADETLPEDADIPAQFTVCERKAVRTTLKVIGIICLAFFGIIEIFMAADCLFSAEPDTETFIFCTVVFSLFIFLGIFLICSARRKISVEGNTVSYLPTFGGWRSYAVSDIASVRGGIEPTARKLCDANGKTIMRYELNQENHALFTAYLANHGLVK